MMFQRCSGNDAVVGFSDGNALLAQFAINVSCPEKYRFGHWQHNRWIQIAPDSLVAGVIGNALENLCQYDAAQGKVLVIENELLQRDHLRQITTREEVDPDAGVNQNH